ncbi:MAG: lytic murein transglycosylase B, partial [Gammaproteobacteria bacterium]|nr:lytic murein transglycosylase B [Gammaproteobacteria bacterium]
MRVAIVLGAAALLLYGPAGADYSQRDDVRAYMDGLVSDHGFDKAELTATFQECRHQPRIVEAISRPAERALKWYEYRRIFIQDARIDQGVAFWTENQASLDAAEERFAVAPEYVVAIIGVETRFGRIMGSHRVVDALCTLGFDYPPR